MERQNGGADSVLSRVIAGGAQESLMAEVYAIKIADRAAQKQHQELFGFFSAGCDFE